MSNQSSLPVHVSSQCNNAKQAESSLIEQLDISPFLKSRIQQRLPCRNTNQQTDTSKTSSTTITKTSPFVLYLPTVNLRIDQNPAFALACRIANYYQLPLVILAVLLDDQSMPLHLSPNASKHKKEVTMTARRLAFLTEALSETCSQWSSHGAGVTIRVHKPHARIPDHLTLSSRAKVVVTDEPFVHPFLSYVHKVEQVCHVHSTPCFRVDGSTTVPPCSILTKVKTGNGSIDSKSMSSSNSSNSSNSQIKRKANVDVDINRRLYYTGVPSKAWMWQKRTESYRMNQLQAAMDGDFDAPPLVSRIDNDAFFMEDKDKDIVVIDVDDDNSTDRKKWNSDNNHDKATRKTDVQQISLSTFPLHWRDTNNEAPGIRPWSVSELLDIAKTTSIKQWAINWPGSDSSVQPCSQTVGTSKAGMQRWNQWITERKGLVYYAKKRTDPLQPHASSRMSCYLNFGIVSIFRIVYEVKSAQKKKSNGADKFEEEIVKWREMSYAHAFARGDYNGVDVVPNWARQWLLRHKYKSSSQLFQKVHDLDCLENCDSGDDVWDAMQGYLVSTGELHNNVRMTWGKMLVHWIHNPNNVDTNDGGNPISNLLHVLCYLNDRFALDGLSPPSYAGLLWCIGWSDKPNSKGEISTKRRYKYAGSRFRDAELNLTSDTVGLVRSSSVGAGVDRNSHGEQTTIFQRIYSTSTPKRNHTNLNPSHHDSQEQNDTSTVKRLRRTEKKTLHDFFQK